jgi:histidyl-tRNA synthetase
MSNHLCTACQSEWDTVRNLLAQLSVSFHHAPLLVRGLDYYEKTVFEFVSSELGAQNTFCGGGRYNHLAEQIGSSKPVPCVGAAIGIERLILLLQDHTKLNVAPPLHIILPLTGKQHALALHLLDLLRGRPYRIDVLLETASVKSMLKTVNRRGATSCIIIGDEEQKAGVAKIKNMATGVETTLPLRDVPAALQH